MTDLRQGMEKQGEQDRAVGTTGWKTGAWRGPFSQSICVSIAGSVEEED